jgi:large conductance mechanosensitive channel
MALYFKAIVDAVLNGVINPIIAAIFGESSLDAIGFAIGDARISIGLVFSAIINFLVVAVFLFLSSRRTTTSSARLLRCRPNPRPRSPC